MNLVRISIERIKNCLFFRFGEIRKLFRQVTVKSDFVPVRDNGF